MRTLTEAVVDAVAEVPGAVGRSIGVEAAQVAVTHLRSRAGGAAFPSIYRQEAGRLWLVAQSGYLEVFDGLSLDRGVMARAARTGETQFVADASAEPDFIHSRPGLVSEVTVPVADLLVNLEAGEALEGRVVAPFERLARWLAERVRLGGSARSLRTSAARSLGWMVLLSTREQIAEYAARIVGQHLGLSVAQTVVEVPDGGLLSALWRGPGVEVAAADPEAVLGLVDAKSAYSAWIGGGAPGFEGWAPASRFVVVPVLRRGERCGGIVGAAPSIAPDRLETETLAAVAAHTSACLDRVALEEELVAALAARRDMVAAVSHELRTPLTAIVGYSELLVSGGLGPDEAGEFVTLVRDNASHLRRLVDDILDVARAEAGRLSVRVDERVSLPSLTAEIAAFVTPQARERGVGLRVDVPPGTDARGDEVRIRQVLVNLLSNAVKFSQDSKVDLVGWSEGDEVVVEVRDEGEGIAPEDLPHLFRPFTGTSVADPRAGSGLGLVISRRLAEAMGGSLVLESPGRGLGATARLVLPSA